MEDKDSLYIENEKKQSCKRTDRNTYTKGDIELNITLSNVFYVVVCIPVFLLFYCLVLE